jgi:hypothetical protein
MKDHTATPPSIPDTSRASVHTGEMDLMKLLGGLDPKEEESRPALTEEQQNHFKDFKYNPYLTNPHKNQMVRTQIRRMSLAPEDHVMLPDGTPSRDSDGENDNSIIKENGSRKAIERGRRKSSSGSLMMNDLGGIQEEKIDPRTGKAITSENPYNNYDPADLGNLPKDTLTPKNQINIGSRKVRASGASARDK